METTNVNQSTTGQDFTMTPPVQEQTSAESAQQEKAEAEAPETAEEKRTLEKLGSNLKRPAVGASVAGVIALGAAVTFGVDEAAIGGAVAYGTYRILRRRKS